MIFRHLRSLTEVHCKSLANSRRIFTNSTLLDESKSGDDNEKQKNKEVVKKLNELIKLMSKKEEPTQLASQIKVPKPREKTKQQQRDLAKKKEIIEKQMENEKIGNRLADAATKVAEKIGGDTKKTEMELLDLFLKRRTHGTTKDENAPEDLEKEKSVPLSELLTGMKVDKESIPRESLRANQVRSMVMNEKPKQFRTAFKTKQYIKVDLFGEEPFGFFDAEKIKEKNVTPMSLPTWDLLYERECKLAITQPPRNIFEQLIQWTEQGKIWRFPIDNEQDWHEEAQYDFSEHVFLEHLIEPWCPESGPVRHFMELVCVGLSKNPFLTVPEKRAHIYWYEHYFRSKKDLLLETGCGEIRDRPTVEAIA